MDFASRSHSPDYFHPEFPSHSEILAIPDCRRSAAEFCQGPRNHTFDASSGPAEGYAQAEHEYRIRQRSDCDVEASGTGSKGTQETYAVPAAGCAWSAGT